MSHPLAKYRDYISRFNLLNLLLKRNYFIIDNDISKMVYNTLRVEELVDLTQQAKNEVEVLLFTHNSNSDRVISQIKRDYFEFGKFYNNLCESVDCTDSQNQMVTSHIYSCFLLLFDDLLKLIDFGEYEIIKEVEVDSDHNPITSSSDTNLSVEDLTELTIEEGALYLYYIGEFVTKQNCNELVKLFGENSGQKLLLKYYYIAKPANRKGKPDIFTKKTLQNKIERFERVIKVLPDAKNKRAIDELNILKNIYKTEFPENY